MPSDKTVPSRPPPRSGDGIRDTIDSIIIAFILAFVFRAFVAEAFVIPTGSMAPSLYGRHAIHRCSNCRYPFAFSVDANEDVLRSQVAITCPNCNSHNDIVGGPSDQQPTESGDRILVLKWPYDFGGQLLGPQRWSVVVFKNPLDGKQNYIKRLIGLPNEALEIIDGDIYTAPADQLSADLRRKLLSDPLAAPNRGLTAADLDSLSKALRIQRKSDSAQDALWMIHYDHDYPPINSVVDAPFWNAGGLPAATGWDASTPHVKFDGRDDAVHSLRLAGKPIADFYAYNTRSFQSSGHDLRYVGDVRLRFVLEPAATKGEFSTFLSRNNDEFQATMQADGTVTLAHRTGDAPWRPLSSAKIDPLAPGKEHLIDFQNADYRVLLRIDERVVVQTNDSQYKPDPSRLLKGAGATGPFDGDDRPAQVAISARGMPLEVRHLSVQRDVFYRSIPTESDMGHTNPYVMGNVAAWGTANNPIYLREGEFFVCGDNSPASKDSRLWWEKGDFVLRRGDAYQRGTVPADQLIGQAFFVYWPSGHRLGERGLPVVPNVGRMRPIK